MNISSNNREWFYQYSQIDKSYQKKDKAVLQAKQATSALLANNYDNELIKETEKLKGQKGSTYTSSKQAKDYVRAYEKLRDEIVQGYKNGTRERYVEDKTSETGYRKMTMEEELNGLKQAFQRAADKSGIKKMITDEFNRLSLKAGSNRTESSTVDRSKLNSTTGYMNTLKKLAPSVEFRTGYSHATDKSGKTLTINPKALEKMQSDPEFEKKMKELIGGVEKMTKIAEAFDKQRGATCVFRHSYIDENGNYCHYAYIKKDNTWNKKLREESRKKQEELIKKTRENSAKKKEELEEVLEEKRAEKATEKAEEEKIDESEENAAPKPLTKAEQLIAEKIESSRDGRIYVDDSEFRSFLETVKEESESKRTVTNQSTDKTKHNTVGVNLDLTV